MPNEYAILTDEIYLRTMTSALCAVEVKHDGQVGFRAAAAHINKHIGVSA
ncbi:hypothetical protein [Ethanoligenens sp.]